MERITEEQIVRALIEAQVPEFRHEITGASGKKLSVYLDHRKLRSFPEQKKIIIEALAQKCDSIDFELLADIPNSAAIIVSSLADRLRIPQISPVLEQKDHGIQRTVLGVYKKGQRTLVIDDAATTGSSLVKGIQRLEDEVSITDALVISDREEGAQSLLTATFHPSVRLHHLTTLQNILQFGAEIVSGTEREPYIRELQKLRERDLLL